MELRRQRLHLRQIGRLLTDTFSTGVRALNSLGMRRLPNLNVKPPDQRYERDRPFDRNHIEVKKLGRFRKVGHCITDNRQDGRSAGMCAAANAA